MARDDVSRRITVTLAVGMFFMNKYLLRKLSFYGRYFFAILTWQENQCST